MVEFTTLKKEPMAILPTQVAKFIDTNLPVVAVGYDGFVLDTLIPPNSSVQRTCYSSNLSPDFFTGLPMFLLPTHSSSISQIVVFTSAINKLSMQIINKWAQMQILGDSLVIYGRYHPSDLDEMKVDISDRSYACITDDSFTIFAGIKVK